MMAPALGLTSDAAWAASAVVVLILLLITSSWHNLDSPAAAVVALAVMALGALLVTQVTRESTLAAATLVGAVSYEESLFRAAPLLLATLLFRGRHLLTLGIVSSVVFLLAHDLETPALVANKAAFTAVFLAILIWTRSVAGAVTLHTASNTLWITLEHSSPINFVLLLDLGLILLASGLVVWHLVRADSSRAPASVSALNHHRKAPT